MRYLVLCGKHELRTAVKLGTLLECTRNERANGRDSPCVCEFQHGDHGGHIKSRQSLRSVLTIVKFIVNSTLRTADLLESVSTPHDIHENVKLFGLHVGENKRTLFAGSFI